MVITHTEVFERRFGNSIPEEGKKFLVFAREGASKIQILVEALRDFWQIQHRTLDLRTFPPDLALRAAFSRVQAQAPVPIELAWDELPVINADEELIVELFSQLLDNAVKFRSAAPLSVHVSAKQDQLHWSISVQDNGVGFEPEYAERILRIFQRLSRHTAGVGIGLSVCKLIMERHEGRIRVTSEPGIGTTVYLDFPSELEQKRLRSARG